MTVPKRVPKPKNLLAVGGDDADLVVGISTALQAEYEGRDSVAWEGSPFDWIRRRASRQVGAIGEFIVERWAQSHKLEVKRSPDSDADRVIEGARIEIKFSTLWTSKNGGYTFQQIRDQNYKFLLCLGISPFKVHAWIIEKSKIPFDKLKHQHGGAKGTDTWWLTFHPDSPPTWLPGKGSLRDVLTVLKKLKK